MDIEHLLTGRIHSCIKNEHWFKRSIYNNAGWLGVTAASLFLSLVGLGLYTGLQPERNAFLAQAQTVLSKSIEEKADFLLRSVTDNPFIHQEHTLIPIIMFPAIICALLIGGAVTAFADNPPKSYLVLSDAAKNDREESLEKRKRNWKYLLASGVTATVAGVCRDICS